MTKLRWPLTVVSGLVKEPSQYWPLTIVGFCWEGGVSWSEVAFFFRKKGTIAKRAGSSGPSASKTPSWGNKKKKMATIICRRAHQEVESVFPLLGFGLAWWLALASERVAFMIQESLEKCLSIEVAVLWDLKEPRPAPWGGESPHSPRWVPAMCMWHPSPSRPGQRGADGPPTSRPSGSWEIWSVYCFQPRSFRGHLLQSKHLLMSRPAWTWHLVWTNGENVLGFGKLHLVLFPLPRFVDV